MSYKITDLSSLTTPASGDFLPIVDISDLTQAATGTTKRITYTNFVSGILAELGITSSVAELNILDGVTSSAAELNILDGVTSTAAELNILDGVTANATEINVLDGIGSLTGVLRSDAGVLSVDSDVTDIVSAASTTAAGKVEIAIASELNTGTDATRAVSPDALAGSNLGIRYYAVEVFAPAANVTTGDGKKYFHIPPALNGMNLVYAHAMVAVAGTTNSTTVQINNVTQTADMLSALLEVESGETGSDTSAPGVTIDTASDDVATNDRLRIDVDTASDTPPQGLVVTLGFQLP